MGKPKFVKKAINWKKMRGSSKLVRKLNAYLTDAFIFSRDVPDDECVDYAEKIAKMDLSNWRKIEKSKSKIRKMLEQAFATDQDEKESLISGAVEAVVAIARLEKQ